MGFIDKAKALVPWSSSKSEKQRLYEDLETWREKAERYEQKYLELRDKHDELKTKYYEEKDKLETDKRQLEKEKNELKGEVKSLKEKLNKTFEEDLQDGQDKQNLTNREKQLYKVVRNNAEQIQGPSDVLDLMKQKHGVEWKQSTLDVNLSRIKSKGAGDLRRFYNQD